ncbi:unnamed protein product [Allacma fusca]|uniref:F-box domain-containing protein n=1 Tax=Allacma fusca TaxID=39272 RepID=A0A8J2PEK5_9HEXA|nr:unnamed protein product [Allacma fusca]
MSSLGSKRSIIELDLTDDGEDDVVILEVISGKKRRSNENETILLDSLNFDSDTTASDQSMSSLVTGPDDVKVEPVEVWETPSTVRVTHPLMIPEILERIFDYLDVDEGYDNHLLPCQFVCLLWSQLVNRRSESLKCYNITVPTPGSLCAFEDLVNSIPPHRYKFSVPSMTNNSMELFCKKVGPHLKSIRLDIAKVDSANNGIPILAKHCPKLEELILDISECDIQDVMTIPNIFLPIKKLLIKTGSHRDRRTFNTPLCLCPHLSSLSFTGDCNDFVNVLSSNKDVLQLSSLKHLEFYSLNNSEITQNFIDFFVSKKWTITNLTLRFHHNIPIFNLRGILFHLRETLVTLKIEFDYPYVKLVMPLQKNFLIPLSMPKLRHIDVNEQSTVALINALHLPNLKSCVCFYTVMARGDMFKEVLSADKSRPETHSLESLTIYDNSIELPIFQVDPAPFTSLKFLHLEHATNVMFEVILSTQMNIERLKICNLYSLKTPKITLHRKIKMKVLTDWDEVLTGLKKPKRFRKEEIAPDTYKAILDTFNLKRIGPSIKNLAKLKHLTLGFDCSSQRPYKLSDFSIYLGLIELKELQHLELNQHVFSELGLTALRKELVPFCRMAWSG